jgi:molybdate-binding protein/DNA-binding XRE family transcriptional regulator
MSEAVKFDNRVKLLRQARGWTQDELARSAGLSRTGVSAIEGGRLIPSVAAGLSLATALGCTVEELFAQQKARGVARFAWTPAVFPCRYWAAEVAGETLLYPVECGSRGELFHDGVARHPQDVPQRVDLARQTMVLASCDPAAEFLASLYARQGGWRMLVFTRSSSESLELVARRSVHVAGVHLASADDSLGNREAIARRGLDFALSLLHVAHWEEGLCVRPSARLRSAAAAVRSKLRWVGRSAGAGARRFQDELLGRRPLPRRVARDHRGIVEAIRNGWADVGVCLRLASEEGQLSFLPVGQEAYDLCFRREDAADPRIEALISCVRSPDYRGLLPDLPGYEAQPHLGDVEQVPSSALG